MNSPGYARWNAALAAGGFGVGAAELHGSMTGYLCAGWCGNAHALLAALELEGRGTAGATDAVHGLVDGAVKQIARGLRTDGTIVPLLPAAPLQARADALVEWCRGFLGGLGLTGLMHGAERTPGTREVLDTLARIAATPLACDEDDDAALADVLDFVGAAIRSLHSTLAPGARG